jgi:hypothetical protein
VIDVSVEGGGLTSRVVVPVEGASKDVPWYSPEIVTLVPTGAADEVHDPEPLDTVAVHSDVDPAEKTTEPLGAGSDVAVTIAV